MCFSARASFLAAGVLLPMGVAALRTGWGKPEQRPLAMAPLLFGLQQGCEGVVWLGIEGAGAAGTESWPSITLLATLAYLFFAYALWPLWIPWAAVALLRRSRPRIPLLVQALPLLGLVPALLLWLPLLAHPQHALPRPMGHALIYGVPPWTLQMLPPLVGPALYGALIVAPLLLVPSLRVRIFGLTLLLAFALSLWSSRAALTSVWCFASALLSAQILWILREGDTLPANPAGGPTQLGIPS